MVNSRNLPIKTSAHKKTQVRPKTKFGKSSSAKKILNEFEEKYFTLVENAPDIIFVVDLEGNFLYLNKTTQKITGYPLSELLKKNLQNFIAQEYHDSIKSIFHNLHKINYIPFYEFEVISSEGKRIPLDIHMKLIRGTRGRMVGIQGIARDITERKKVEEALKESKEKIKEVTQQIERFSEISADILSTEDDEELFSRIALAVVDISDFNRVLISFFIDEPPYREIIGSKGVKKEDLERVKKINMPREKYLKYFEKGIKIGNQSCYIPHRLKNILDQKAVIPGEKLYPKKEGRWHREDNLLVSMNDTKGQLIGIISVDDSESGLVPTNETVRPLEIYANLISEIIQRRKLVKKIKESEEKYRDLISNIKVGIFRATPEGELLEVNPSALEMFGFEDGKKFLKLKIEDLYQNSDDNEKFMKEIEKKGLVKNKEFLLRKRECPSFWASLTSTAVEDTSGQIVYYDTVIEDITERKKLEEEVKRLSITDELTGLFNRRYFNEHLPKEIRTAERWRSTLSLIMIDIDDFKPYNDSFHHLKGDEVIKEVAQVISQNIRKGTDWASRFGGDEYAIILPGTDTSEATTIAQRIRKAFHEIKFRPEGHIVKKTISMGIAYCFYGGSKFKKQIKDYRADYEKIATELTNLADSAMFKAKKSGKNKVFISKKPIELSRM